jgi:peptidase C39-like protein
MADLSYAQAVNITEGARVSVTPTRTAVLSWNTYSPNGRIAFRLLREREPATPWIDYAEWNETERRSFSARSDGVQVEVDVIHANEPFDGVEVHAGGVDFNLVAVSTPREQRASLPYYGDAHILDVPKRSQYVKENKRDWCSPASLAMIHAFHGIDEPVATVAERVFDRAYEGTGNWSLNVAYSGSLGFRAGVAYLENLDRAQQLIDLSLPLALSISWRDGELPDAPLEHSEGHLVVLCGFTANGDCAINDPAAPPVRVVYPRAALERVWLRSGGVAFVIAPAGIAFERALAQP